VADVLRAQLLGERWERDEGIDLLLGEQPPLLGVRMDDPVDLAPGVDPHVRQHGRQEDVLWRAELYHRHGFPFEVTDRADPFRAE
jgi:hypothetical protein